jgi:hypothetical protein
MDARLSQSFQRSCKTERYWTLKLLKRMGLLNGERIARKFSWLQAGIPSQLSSSSKIRKSWGGIVKDTNGIFNARVDPNRFNDLQRRRTSCERPAYRRIPDR